MANLGTLTSWNTDSTSDAKVRWHALLQNSFSMYGDATTKGVVRQWVSILPTKVGAQLAGTALLAVDTTGSISGTTAASGVTKATSLVYLFLRDNMTPVYATRSDASGAYSFPKLDKTRSDYLVVALPPSGATLNAAVLDTLTPV